MAPNSLLSTCLIFMFIVTSMVFSDDCPPSCVCMVKKFSLEVECTSKGIQELRIERLPKSTVELDLSDNQIRIIRRDSFPVSKSVKRLYLKRNHLEYIEPGALAKFPNLAKLYLQVNHLKKIEQNTFSGVRSIKHLNISQNKLIDIHQHAFSSMRKLKRISLKQNRLTTFREYTFPNNSKIELDGNQLICDCGMSWLIKKSPKKKGVSEDTKCAYPKSLAGKRLKELGGSKWNCRSVEFELPGFNVAPSINQVVFQNDSFQLTCSNLWQPRGHLVWKLINGSLHDISVKEHHDVNARKNKSILTINRVGLHHDGIYMCQALLGAGMQVVKKVSVSVVGWETRFCPLEYHSTEKGMFSWHSTVSGATATISCPFDERRKAQRTCTHGKWRSPDLSNCLYENVLTRKLDALSKRAINKTSMAKISSDLTYIAKKYRNNFTETKQLKMFADIAAAKLPMVEKLQQEIRKSFAMLVTSVISMSDVAFANDEKASKEEMSGLLFVLEKFMKDSLDQELRSKTQNIPVMLPVTSQVAAFSRSYIYVANSKQDLACTVLFKNLSYPNTPTIGECKENANATSIDKTFDAQIVVPSELFSLATPYSEGGLFKVINVTFIGYKSPELFADSTLDGVVSRRKNTTINSAVIGIHVQVPGMSNADIVSSIVMSFKHFKTGTLPRLVYWSEDSNPAKKSQWKINTKCKLITEKAKDSKFICSELPGKMTYFTVVMDVTKETKRRAASFDLEFVTHVGAGICAFFLLLTFLTYAAFRELRYNRNDAATLMNLCLALIVAVILFVTGINRVENMLLCKAFSVLLHYFLLCCLLWVGCGGACMTVLVRKGPDKEEYNPVLKYYLIAWGVPMLVCGITLAGNPNNYNITSYCWLTPQASIGAFIIPGGLIVIINMIIFLRLHNLVNKKFPEGAANKRLNGGGPMINHAKPNETVKQVEFHFPDRSELLDFVKGSLLVMLILCIDCGFVVMIFVNRKGSSRYLYHLFSYGLAIANMILGLAVFIFHCIRREDVLVCYKSLFYNKRLVMDAQNGNEVETLLEPLPNPVLSTPLRSNGGLSRVSSDHNNEQSDVISAFSAAHSHFTHDVPSSRPSSIFGPSAADPKGQGKHGKLTLPIYDNNKPMQRVSESESNIQPPMPTAPPLPLTGFAAYPPSTIPEAVMPVHDIPTNAAVQSTALQNTATPDFTITTVSERTFSDTSNLQSDIRAGARHFEALRENVTSDHSSVPSHVDPVLRQNHNGHVPLRNIVAPNWKPVRRGGSSAVFYPYVDPNFKSLQSPGPNSLNSVITTTSSMQQQQQQQNQSPARVEPLATVGPFTIPHRSEVIGATNSNKTPSIGNQTDQDQMPKRQSDNETMKQAESEAQPKKVERVNKSRTATRRRRMRSRTRFDDLPVEKCLIYVPLIEEIEKPVPIGNETSV